MFVVFAGRGGSEHIVALLHGDLHTAGTISRLKQVADCIFSLSPQQTCQLLQKHQSGKPVISVCVVPCSKIDRTHFCTCKQLGVTMTSIWLVCVVSMPILLQFMG